MVLADVALTVRDLGISGILGAIVGALISHYAAKARGDEEHERTLDLLVTQDERRTAQSMLDAARRISKRVNLGVDGYGELHNEWSDGILAPATLIRDQEIQRRAKAGAYVIFLGTLLPDEYASYAVLRGALDVEEWLTAWLRREQPPTAHLPTMEEIGELVRPADGGGFSLDPLTDWLIDSSA
jgi:hypothetical protein